MAEKGEIQSTMSFEKEANAAEQLLAKRRQAAVLMSNDILPLVLDFIPRKEMRRVALVCRFFKKTVASHLEPVFLTFKTNSQPYHDLRYRPLLFSLKSQQWSLPNASHQSFEKCVEWTKLNGFYYAISRETTIRYDPIDDVWTELESQTCERRQEFGFTALNDKMYLVGGKNVPEEANVEAYDTESEEWEWVPSIEGDIIMCSAASLNGYVYVVGGVDNEGVRDRVERWSPGNDAWETVASLHQARWSCEVCRVETRLYVFGGLSWTSIHDIPFVPEKTCEVYCPVRNQWTVITTMPTFRIDFSLAVVDHCVYIMGGEIHSGQAAERDGQPTNLVEIFDTHTNTWSTGVSMPE